MTATVAADRDRVRPGRDEYRAGGGGVVDDKAANQGGDGNADAGHDGGLRVPGRVAGMADVLIARNHVCGKAKIDAIGIFRGRHRRRRKCGQRSANMLRYCI